MNGQTATLKGSKATQGNYKLGTNKFLGVDH